MIRCRGRGKPLPYGARSRDGSWRPWSALSKRTRTLPSGKLLPQLLFRQPCDGARLAVGNFSAVHFDQGVGPHCGGGEEDFVGRRSDLPEGIGDRGKLHVTEPDDRTPRGCQSITTRFHQERRRPLLGTIGLLAPTRNARSILRWREG